MAMTPGLSQSLRLIDPNEQAVPMDGIDVDVSEGEESHNTDSSGRVLEIEYPDGSIEISMDGQSLVDNDEENSEGWFSNLVEKIDDAELSRISDDLLTGIRDDLSSRKEWIDDRAKGIKLLGLQAEFPGTVGSAEGAPVAGISTVRHPLLLEAVLRFQANARAELLPTDGPVKIRNDTNNSTYEDDQLSNALERDMNHYLTSTAKEYYPDTDRMLLMLGFGGSAFKKVYFCPLRNRPVSDSVDADDLIVNNAATDLSNAKRITHRIFMRPSTVKRMQILGVYRDIDLGTPKPSDPDAVKREKAAQQGIDVESMSPDDRDREIYECYCELDIKGFEHKRKGKVTGLEIPYRVTIDLSSGEILSVIRNYNESTKGLPEARQVFVKYTFVPGMGFYDIGLLHILGNTTNAITAAWRELLDAGMYANFPGFLMADTGARQNTNIFRVPPGGGALVKTGGMPINQAIMPLPYKEPGQALMSLVENMAQTGMRVGGTSEMQVGEGRADAPVGTTLAMIDQATKILNSVHKRMHTAQAEEFSLLLDCFKENPEAFWERNRRPAYPWDEQTFMKAVDDFDLVPQADPNTASHGQRLMKIMALKQLQAANPGLYDPIAVDTAALQGIGWSNPQQFMAPLSAQGKIPPEVQQKMAEIQIKKQDADTKAKLADAKIAEVQAKIAQPQDGGGVDPAANQKLALDAQQKEQEMNLKMMDLDVKSADIKLDAENRAADRESRERVALAKIIQDLLQHPEGANAVRGLLTPEMINNLQNPG